MRAGLFFLLAASTWGFSALALGQDDRSEEQKERQRIEIDFSADYEGLPEDLERSLRWKNLFQIFGVSEFHIFPSRVSGPYAGPPLRIWGNGWGTSLWRDPVTGWPLQ